MRASKKGYTSPLITMPISLSLQKDDMNKTNLFDCTVYCLFCIAAKLQNRFNEKIYLKVCLISKLLSNFYSRDRYNRRLFTPPSFSDDVAKIEAILPRFSAAPVCRYALSVLRGQCIRFCKYNSKRHAVFTPTVHGEVYLLRFVPSRTKDKSFLR